MGERRVRRVLMTADAVGGVWQYTMDLCAGLAAQGIEATVAVMGPAPTGEQRAEARERGVRLAECACRLEWMDDAWEDVDRAAGWLLELERRTAPDVVHLNGYAHAALPWRAPAMVAAHSCVWSWWRAVHGRDAPPEWVTYRERVIRGLRSARLIVAPTAAMLEMLRREYGPHDPARVIPNGRRVVDAAGREEPLKEPLIVAAGRVWDPAKNIDALCDVAPLLDWPVVVAGEDGWGGRRVMASGVRQLGRLPQPEVQAWLTRAAIYALPARYEPFGLSVLEAAAAGCALVLGDIPSLRENWSGAAVFVPPEDRDALRRALRGLIAEPAARADLARRARVRAEAFTAGRMTSGYLAAYEDLASGDAAVRDGRPPAGAAV